MDGPGVKPRPQVLVVDDDPSIRRTVAAVLDDEGYEVLEAVNGRDALDVTLEAAPCAIILDLNMPVMDGPTFLRAMRQRGLGVPVMILSAVNAVRAAAELGANAGMNKPFDIDALVETVAALVRADRN